MKADTVEATRIWLGEFTLAQATNALKTMSEQEGGMQFPPTLSQLRARILERTIPPPAYHLPYLPPPEPPLEKVVPVPEDLRFLYRPKEKTNLSAPDRAAPQSSP